MTEQAKLYRPLFCPICGEKVVVKVENNGQLPEVHRLPEHESANGMNVCAALVVVVSLSYDKCSKCERLKWSALNRSLLSGEMNSSLAPLEYLLDPSAETVQFLLAFRASTRNA